MRVERCYQMFLGADIDILVMQNYVIYKEDVPLELREKYNEEFELY